MAVTATPARAISCNGKPWSNVANDERRVVRRGCAASLVTLTCTGYRGGKVADGPISGGGSSGGDGDGAM